MSFKMFLSIAVLVIIGTLNIWGQKPTDEDPYLLWQTKEGYEAFLVHPNGNIIAMKGLIISELNGSTGEVIRVFNIKAPVGDISPDGKYLLILTDSVTIIDYETEAVVKKLKVRGAFPNLRYFPDGNRIIYLYQSALGVGLDSSAVLYDFLKDEYTFLDFNYSKPALATSPDGRYFASGGTWKEQVGIEEKKYTYLTLWDAQTLKPVKHLGKIEGNSEVRSIKFSPDGKYVGFHVGFHDFYTYKLSDLTQFKLYNQTNIEFPPLAFAFLNSGLISFTSLQINEKNRFISILSLDNDFIKYRYLGKIGYGTPAYMLLDFNSFNNSLVFTGPLFSIDLNKILTSVPESDVKNNFTVQYNKRTIILSDFNSIAGEVNITISDINGRVISKLNFAVSGSELRIPLILPSGTYLIHIQDGNREYSSKFLVTD